MKQELRSIAVSERRHISKWVAFSALAVGLVLAVLSYLSLLPLNYKLGPYWLNHWMSWFSFSFIIIYVPIFVILKRRNTKIRGKLIRIHQVGFMVAFMLVSIHMGSQIRRVFPPEIGTGIAAYVSLLVLVVTGIMQRNQMFITRIGTIRFVHRSMVVSFFLVIVFHVIRAFLL